MKTKKEDSQNTFSSRIRSSLVLKLNLEIFIRLLTGFLAINTLILVMSFFMVIWEAEIAIQDIAETANEIPQSEGTAIGQNREYEIISIKKPKGIKLPKGVQNLLPIQIKDAKRNISIDKSHSKDSWVQRIRSLRYSVSLSLDMQYYEISYEVGPRLLRYLRLLLTIIIVEILILLRNLVKGQRSIRKTLKPLAELAEKAKTLNALQSFDDKNLKDMAGEISSIDASKLDKRISVDSSQNELKDLASAINGMLNRINQSYQSQVRFVSDASHELRTPISVIQGYINLLDRWGKEDEKALQESIDAIKDEIEAMKNLVEKLLFLARGDNETIQLHKEVFDSCEVIGEIIKETEMIHQEHKLISQLESPALIEADRQLFKQAIRILVDNSLKYSPKGKEIVLKVKKAEESISIVVQDSGIGIDGEDLPQIFDRFYRSDESRARKSGGSGLGLSIAKWIVERHGAYFEIVSRINIGTRITVTFPTIPKE
ncbi:MAG: ATP-binding protein [Tissierellaceae bacterium]|nr:ATP-binding protein [Tissierellaceae bacterium]